MNQHGGLEESASGDSPAASELDLGPSFSRHEHAAAETLTKELTCLGDVVFEEYDRAQCCRALRGERLKLAESGEQRPPRRNPYLPYAVSDHRYLSSTNRRLKTCKSYVFCFRELPIVRVFQGIDALRDLSVP